MKDRSVAAPWWTGATALTALLVGGVCGVILWAFTPPVVAYPQFALAAAGLLILGGIWLVLALVGWFRYRALRWSTVAPALVLLTAALVAAAVPSRVAFAVSKDALLTAAHECPDSFETRRIGLYTVWQTLPVENGCLFFVEGGLIDSIGLAYLPGGAPRLGEPRHDGDIGYQVYEEDWYTIVRRF